MQAELHLNAWYGQGKWPVEIVKETPKRYLIRILHDGTMTPGGATHKPGAEVLVKKSVIKVINAAD